MPGGIGSGGIVDIPFPADGPTGYVLGKTDNADYAFDWVPPAGAGGGVLSVSAGTSNATGPQVIFSNSNGISFGANGNTITASVAGAGGGGAALSAGTQSANTGTIVLSNANGITFGMSNSSVITASHNGLTSQSNQAFSANGGSSAFQTLGFSDGNGVSFTNTNGSLGATVRTNYASSDHSHGNPQLNLTNLSGTTASNSAGFTLSLSAADPGAGGVTPVVSANNGSYSFTTLSLSNANGISFGTSAGSAVTASYTVPSVTQYFSATNTTFNGANISGSMTLNTNGLQLSMSVAGAGGAASQTVYATGNTTINSSGTMPLSSLVMRAYGIVSLGTSNGSLLVSSPDAVDFTQLSVGMSTNGNTSGNTGLVTGQLVLAGGNNITLSGSTNAGSMTLTVSAASQTNQSLGIYGSNNTTGQSSSSTVDARSLTFVGQGNVSVGLSAGLVLISGGTAAAAPVNFSAGTTSGNLGTIVFSNSNNVSFGLNGSTITASIAGGGGGGVGVGVSTMGNTAGTTGTVTTGNVVLVGSGPISLSQSSSGSNATISINGPAVSSLVAGANITISTAGSTISIIGATVAGQPVNFSAGTTSSGLGSVVFSDSNGISFGLNGSTVTASHNGLTSQTVQTQSNVQGLIVSDTTYRTGDVSFSNANGISFGSSAGQAITASYTVPSTAGLISRINVSGGTTSNNLSALTFADGNGVSFGLNGSTLTASHNGLTSQSNQAFSADGGSSAFQTLNFRNANGISFSNSNGSVQASYTVPTVPAQLSVGNSNLGNTAGDTGVVTGRLVFVGSNNITLSGSTNGGSMTISISGGAGAAGNTGSISAGTTRGTLGELVMSNSNGISFGIDGQTLTASHNGLTSQSNQAVSAANGSYAFQTLSFSNANGVSFGTSAGSAITASYTVPAPQTGISALQVSNTTYSSGTVTFQNANGISFGSSGANGISASYTVPSTAGLISAVGVTGQNGNFTTTGLSFSNANGISFGTSAGSAVTASHNALTSQSNQAFSASGGSSAFQTLNFVNGNGATFTNNAGSVGISYTVPSVTQYFSATNTTFSGTNVSGSLTLNTNGLRVDLSVAAGGGGGTAATVYATGNTTQSSSGTQALSSLIFRGEGIASVGMTNGSVVVSVPSGGGAGMSLGMSTQGNTAGTTGLVSNNYLMVGSGPISLSQSVNGQSATLSINGPALSSLSATGQVSISTNGSTISIGVPNPFSYSGFNPYADIEKIAGQYGQATLQFDPVRAPNFVMDRVLLPIINTNSSNSSGSHTLSFWVGLYTQNVSTLSLLHSVSASTALTHSGTAGSYSLYSGNRLFTMGLSATLTEGDYWLAFVSRTTTAGTNGSYSNLIASNIASNFLGFFGSSNNTTQQLTIGQGVYTASTSGIPSSVAFSQIRGSDSQARRAAFIRFGYSTV